jgi:hypothetical protein
VSIQTEILDTIGDGGIEVAELRGKLGNVGANELSDAVNELIRGRFLRVADNRYVVVKKKPPTADEELAANLGPVMRVCVTCKGEPQPLQQFRVVGPGEKRADECNGCWRKRARVKRPREWPMPDINVSAPVVIHSARRDEGVEALKVGHQTVNLAGTPPIAGSSPANSTTSDSRQREGDNRDVSTEHAQKAAAVPETSRSYSRSDPSEDARTLASAERVSPVFGAGNGHPFDNSPFANDPIFTRVTMRKRAVLNRVALLQVELENLMSEVRDCDRFIELYERFSAETKAS